MSATRMSATRMSPACIDLSMEPADRHVHEERTSGFGRRARRHATPTVAPPLSTIGCRGRHGRRGAAPARANTNTHPGRAACGGPCTGAGPFGHADDQRPRLQAATRTPRDLARRAGRVPGPDGYQEMLAAGVVCGLAGD